MSQLQRYVSDELSHFVGRGKSDDEQFDILVNRVLKPGWLTYAPHDPTQPRTASLDFSKPISGDETIRYQVVCFCDIPISDLAIHVAKYSRFGLAFRKGFLIQKGASPVSYVANESPVPDTWPPPHPGDLAQRIHAATGAWSRALYFDASVRVILDLLVALDAMCAAQPNYFNGADASEFKARFQALLGLSDSQIMSVDAALRNNAQASTTIRASTNFLLNYVFSFMKCFDAHQSFESEANFYMEREWRLGANLQFQLADVARVFFPRKYAEEFRSVVPDYFGQISFVD